MEDDVGFLNMFGEDADEEVEETTKEVQKSIPDIPLKTKDDSCPFVGDPKGVKVRVKYEDQLFSATIKSYQSDSNTYTISWTSSGVLQYRTKPEDINWDKFEEEVVATEVAKVEEDELWLAARRGSLKSVKKFIENGVNFNETGKSQQRTPFYHAVFCGHVPVVEYLIELGAQDSDNTAFITANADVREILIKAGIGGKRRASIKKNDEIPVEVKSELRRASVTKAAGVHVASIASEVSPSQLAALQDLETRLLAVEAAMKAEKRRPSVKQVSDDATKPVLGETTTKSGRVTFANGTKESKKNNSSALVAQRTKSKNPILRFLVAIVPSRFFRSRRKQQ